MVIARSSRNDDDDDNDDPPLTADEVDLPNCVFVLRHPAIVTRYTYSDPSTATTELIVSPVKLSIHTADDVLMYLAQLSGIVCQSDYLRDPTLSVGVMLKVTYLHVISGPPSGPVLFFSLASVVCRRRRLSA